jgi:cell division protein FtsB
MIGKNFNVIIIRLTAIIKYLRAKNAKLRTRNTFLETKIRRIKNDRRNENKPNQRTA